MKILIAERLRPFSHLPGTLLPIPQTFYAIQVFPTLVRFYDLSENRKKDLGEIFFPFNGPVKDFTVQLDLERGRIRVWQETKDGFVRLNIYSSSGKVFLEAEKSPFDCSYESKNLFLERVETHLFTIKELKSFEIQGSEERLSLGCHKTQNWENVKNRSSLAEIFPHWMRLASYIPPINQKKFSGVFSLLTDCKECIKQRKRIEILSSFQLLWKAGFEGLLMPRAYDSDYQGIVDQKVHDTQNSPLLLLQEGARLIRSLFIEEEGIKISILPSLPVEFHQGRFTSISLLNGSLDIEWTKKFLRKMIFHAKKPGEYQFAFGKEVKKCRLRKNEKDQGIIWKAGEKVIVEENSKRYFDHFEA